MQLKKKKKGPGDSPYQQKRKSREVEERIEERRTSSETKNPVSAQTASPVQQSPVRSGRIMDNVAFIYVRVGAREPTILLSREDDEAALRLPVAFKKPGKFANCRMGLVVSDMGPRFASWVTQGLGIVQEFRHWFCNFFPREFSLHEGKTSAWAIGPLETGDFEQWELRFETVKSGTKVFKSQWFGVSELDPEAIRPAHRQAILLSIPNLKRVHQHRFDQELDTFAKRLADSLV